MYGLCREAAVEDPLEMVALGLISYKGMLPDRAPRYVEDQEPEIVELADGDTLDLRIAPVAKRLSDVTVRMLAYNGSIPGPILKVQEGSLLGVLLPSLERETRTRERVEQDLRVARSIQQTSLPK